jgi:hypothetical protein
MLSQFELVWIFAWISMSQIKVLNLNLLEFGLYKKNK